MFNVTYVSHLLLFMKYCEVLCILSLSLQPVYLMHKFPVVFVIDFSILLHHSLSYRVSLFETGGHNVQSA